MKPAPGFEKPLLGRPSLSKGRSISCVWEGHLKCKFHKASLPEVFLKTKRREEKTLNIPWVIFS